VCQGRLTVDVHVFGAVLVFLLLLECSGAGLWHNRLVCVGVWLVNIILIGTGGGPGNIGVVLGAFLVLLEQAAYHGRDVDVFIAVLLLNRGGGNLRHRRLVHLGARLVSCAFLTVLLEEGVCQGRLTVDVHVFGAVLVFLLLLECSGAGLWHCRLVCVGVRLVDLVIIGTSGGPEVVLRIVEEKACQSKFLVAIQIFVAILLLLLLLKRDGAGLWHHSLVRVVVGLVGRALLGTCGCYGIVVLHASVFVSLPILLDCGGPHLRGQVRMLVGLVGRTLVILIFDCSCAGLVRDFLHVIGIFVFQVHKRSIISSAHCLPIRADEVLVHGHTCAVGGLYKIGVIASM